MDACFGSGLPVLLADDLNVKHVDGNSRLTNENGESYVITPTGNPI
jgi:hypothetical protein